MIRNVDVAIIGGGPAGLAAAVECYEQGVKDVVIIERDVKLGGILQQCIHNGFGLHMFKEELTGPEYAQRYIDKVERYGIESLLDSMVLEITPEKLVYAINPKEGLVCIRAKAVILCMGCRERTRHNLKIPGTRPAGVYTAGMVQRLTNLEGFMPGKEIVVLGSGDIGLIMARRLMFEGAKIKGVYELMPYSTGLQRNIRQCLEDFDIPLWFNHTVINIHGRDRLTGVTVAEVDENRNVIKGSEKLVECDTLLLSVGLIPENEVATTAGVQLDRITSGPVVDAARQTNVPGVFAAGNTLHVHDLVDYVSEEAEIAARGAVQYVRGEALDPAGNIQVSAGKGVRYIVPQVVNAGQESELYFRPDGVYRDGELKLCAGDEVIFKKKFIRLTPGEMERIRLSARLLDKAGGRALSLRCV
jgi:NADPH-dependent 2,4-dienoyl-CoA reductase/sulfur reductase-like enzyme